MIRVATEAGLRIGEIAGLQRRDIYFAARTITVNWHEQLGQPNPVATVKRPRTDGLAHFDRTSG